MATCPLAATGPASRCACGKTTSEAVAHEGQVSFPGLWEMIDSRSPHGMGEGSVGDSVRARGHLGAMAGSDKPTAQCSRAGWATFAWLGNSHAIGQAARGVI
ncbi:hypothetical protein SNOG_12061 [Parastagonospora nodorum SN15]|uniref:Uncharacterized protein n=1 Tax=Phaeosphaeria nodorum (strain SN15 / ATCC MYA-4574 / FGSC 10173) TaxID=321614 RepID=Q0U853_PHANO|nr:hypothetical protein SNOG_12061 [Parastagonospora nodorum SN15]EAT80473.1 hypothetical protein SNOG_12061 [Parastagonospora nodorum SN15]